MAGLDDTALRVYLNHKATAWYWRFPHIHSLDSAEDPKMPKVAGGDEEGKSPEDEDDIAERPVEQRPSLLRMRPKAGARNEAQSAQHFLPLSEIAWYIAGVLYSRGAICHLS